MSLIIIDLLAAMAPMEIASARLTYTRGRSTLTERFQYIATHAAIRGCPVGAGSIHSPRAIRHPSSRGSCTIMMPSHDNPPMSLMHNLRMPTRVSMARL